MRRLLSASWAPAAVLAAAVVVPAAASSYWVSILTQALVFALLAASLDLLAGHARMQSLGHGAFYGLGAYAVGYTTTQLGWSPWAAAAAAVLVAGLVGLGFGAVAVRTRALYFLVVTIAFGQLLWGVAIKWTDVTGGYNGLPGVERPALPGLDLDDTATFFRFVLVVVACLIWAVRRMARSPVGLVLRGIGSNELRMAFVGYRTYGYRLLVFTVTATIAGGAGALAAFDARFVSPDTLHWVLSAQVLLIVIVGGAGTVFGPALAGLGIVVLNHVVTGATDRWVLVLGVLYIATVLVAPNGVLRAVAALQPRLPARLRPARVP